LAARADTIVITPVKDNSLYEDATGSLSNGAGSNVYAGRTSFGGGQALRRGLVAFDVASLIPPSATVTAVQLTMTVTNINLSTPGSTVTLHRVQADWGEGTSAGSGSGAVATPGDATWVHRFSPTVFWASPGGDFVAAASAATPVTSTGPVTWSSAGLLADVQSWVNAPSTNFGWMIRGNEAVPATGMAFASREAFNTASRPMLMVTFTPVPEPSFVMFTAVAGLFAWRRLRRRTPTGTTL
jgi:hypothetical protein